MWASIVHSFMGLNRMKGGKRRISYLFCMSHSLSWTFYPIFSALGLGFTLLTLLALMPLDSGWLIPLALLSLQFADGRSWDFSASIITWTYSSNKFLSLCLSEYWYTNTGIYTGVEFLDNTVTLCFSIVGVLIYILTSGTWEFQLLHYFINM